MSTDGLVTLRNVHKIFRRGGERIDVLQGVNLDLPQGDFRFGRDFGGVFQAPAQNVFLVKVSYWINP